MWAARAVQAGEPNLTVPMPVFACTGASIENNVVFIVACIDLYFGLYWSVLDCIGIVLVNVLASVFENY